MPRPLLSALVALACACGPTVPSPAEQARADLAAALATRDPSTVSAAARAAAELEGTDPALDRLLGDALANVLMRPADGLALLRSHPAPEDPAWVDAYLSATLRTGDPVALESALRDTPMPSPGAPPDLVAWLGARALRDPSLGYGQLVTDAHTCDLWDRRPLRGRRSVDQPVPDGFLGTLPLLGAMEVLVGRATVPTDPSPTTGQGLQPCLSGRLWPESRWPEPLPKHVTVAIATRGESLYLSIRPEGGSPWVFASTRADVAGQLVEQVRAVQAGSVADSEWLVQRLQASPPPTVPPLVE